MSTRDLNLPLTIPAELSRRIHDLPQPEGVSDGTLGDRILRLLELGTTTEERRTAEPPQLDGCVCPKTISNGVHPSAHCPWSRRYRP